MISDVLPQLAAGGVRTVRHILEQPASEDMPAAEVRALLRQSALALDFVRGHCAELSAVFQERGMEPNQLNKAAQASLEALDAIMGLTAGLRDRIRRHADPTAAVAQLEEVGRLEAQANELRRPFAEWAEAASRPLPADFWEKARRAAEEAAPRAEWLRVDGYEDLFGDAKA